MYITEINEDKDGDELIRVLQQANTANPPPQAIAELRQVLDNNPAIWQSVSNLNAVACSEVIDTLALSPIFNESLRKGMADLKRELGYHESSISEKLVIDQIALHYLNFHLAQNIYNSMIMQVATTTEAKILEQRLNSSEKRYLKAIETLARIRKLGITGPVQINIGTNQVNTLNAV